jgi:uncharacterized glyoxalase superfamily protein PhnB
MATSAAPATKTATLTPYICVADAKAALTWYADAFGAVEEVRYVGDDGRIGHAEITIEGARLMLSDEYAEAGVAAPLAGRGHDVALHLNVADVDDMFARAVARGATAEREPADQPYGERSSTITDPFGHRWMIQTPSPPRPTRRWPKPRWKVSRHGAADSCRGSATSRSASPTPGKPVVSSGFVRMETEQGNSSAIRPRRQHPPSIGFTPDGIDAPRPCTSGSTASTVTPAGSGAGRRVVSRATYDSGPNAVCRDDQGREFQLWQAAPGY